MNEMEGRQAYRRTGNRNKEIAVMIRIFYFTKKSRNKNSIMLLLTQNSSVEGGIDE